MKALEAFYQGKHWTAKGPLFYSAHLMFAKLYEVTSEDIDAVAEIALADGTEEALIESSLVLEEACALLKKHDKSVGSKDTLGNALTTAVALEQSLLTLIEELIATIGKDTATNNLLAGIADSHKRTNLYLLKQHLKLK